MKNKMEAVELIATEYDDLAIYKQGMNERISAIFSSCGINDKPVQRAIIKTAQALSKDKLVDACEEADEISNLCRAKMQPVPLFEVNK